MSSEPEEPSKPDKRERARRDAQGFAAWGGQRGSDRGSAGDGQASEAPTDATDSTFKTADQAENFKRHIEREIRRRKKAGPPGGPEGPKRDHNEPFRSDKAVPDGKDHSDNQNDHNRGKQEPEPFSSFGDKKGVLGRSNRSEITPQGGDYREGSARTDLNKGKPRSGAAAAGQVEVPDPLTNAHGDTATDQNIADALGRIPEACLRFFTGLWAIGARVVDVLMSMQPLLPVLPYIISAIGIGGISIAAYFILPSLWSCILSYTTVLVGRVGSAFWAAGGLLGTGAAWIWRSFGWNSGAVPDTPPIPVPTPRDLVAGGSAASFAVTYIANKLRSIRVDVRFPAVERFFHPMAGVAVPTALVAKLESADDDIRGKWRSYLYHDLVGLHDTKNTMEHIIKDLAPEAAENMATTTNAAGQLTRTPDLSVLSRKKAKHRKTTIRHVSRLAALMNAAEKHRQQLQQPLGRMKQLAREVKEELEELEEVFRDVMSSIQMEMQNQERIDGKVKGNEGDGGQEQEIGLPYLHELHDKIGDYSVEAHLVREEMGAVRRRTESFWQALHDDNKEFPWRREQMVRLLARLEHDEVDVETAARSVLVLVKSMIQDIEDRYVKKE